MSAVPLVSSRASARIAAGGKPVMARQLPAEYAVHLLRQDGEFVCMCARRIPTPPRARSVFTAQGIERVRRPKSGELKFTYKKNLFRLRVKPMLYWPHDKRKLTYGEVVLTHLNKVEVQPPLPAWKLQWRLMKMRIKSKVHIVWGYGMANFCLDCVGQHAQAWKKSKCYAVHGVRRDDVRGVHEVRGVQ